MLERGWEVTACDISPAMVELARAKVGDRATLSVADMRELPVFGEFDLVFCLDDAVNYLLDVEELEQALTGMRRNLAPSGLLMFDVNTLQTYRTFFAEEVVVERDGRRLVWQGRSTAGRPAALDRRGELRGRAARRRAGPERSSRRCTASATSPKRRSWRRWSEPASSASTSTATATTRSCSSRSTKAPRQAVYIARSSRRRRGAGMPAWRVSPP